MGKITDKLRDTFQSFWISNQLYKTILCDYQSFITIYCRYNNQLSANLKSFDFL